jgi:hypothetical protein
MRQKPSKFTLEVESTTGRCPIGEKIGRQNMDQGKIPVFSCEGACIRGEIARQAANMVAQQDPYRRGCHGELFAVPHAAMAEWAKKAPEVIVIDGCFLRCHGRIMKDLVGEERLVGFDALSHYKKYSDIFDIDGVPEEERNGTARGVADWVLESMKTA